MNTKIMAFLRLLPNLAGAKSTAAEHINIMA